MELNSAICSLDTFLQHYDNCTYDGSTSACYLKYLCDTFNLSYEKLSPVLQYYTETPETLDETLECIALFVLFKAKGDCAMHYTFPHPKEWNCREDDYYCTMESYCNQYLNEDCYRNYLRLHALERSMKYEDLFIVQDFNKPLEVLFPAMVELIKKGYTTLECCYSIIDIFFFTVESANDYVTDYQPLFYLEDGKVKIDYFYCIQYLVSQLGELNKLRFHENSLKNFLDANLQNPEIRRKYSDLQVCKIIVPFKNQLKLLRGLNTLDCPTQFPYFESSIYAYNHYIEGAYNIIRNNIDNEYDINEYLTYNYGIPALRGRMDTVHIVPLLEFKYLPRYREILSAYRITGGYDEGWTIKIPESWTDNDFKTFLNLNSIVDTSYSKVEKYFVEDVEIKCHYAMYHIEIDMTNRIITKILEKVE